MKLFTAGLATESNTFSPIPTGLDDFVVFRGAPPPERPTSFVQPFLVFHRLAAERGWTVASSLGAAAPPAGPTVRRVYEGFRDEILADLRAAMPVDAVLLNLHGAMVADGYDDCEGDLLEGIRRLVGPAVPVGAELDPHCHVTPLMVEAATALVLYKEFPHTDFAERAADLFTLVTDAARRATRPHMALWDCRMIGSYFTTLQPMKGFVDHVKALEGTRGVLSISPVHGFPYGDVPGNGTKVLVITDDRPDEGATLARELGLQWIALRGRTHPEMLTVARAVDRARRVAGRPVVMADVADNPGGGFAGDSTVVLRELRDLGVTDAAFATIWDPIAVSLARAAGPGARLTMRIGGKTGVLSGDPLDLEVTVTAVTDDLYQRYAGVGSSLGPAAALSTGGLEVIVASRRNQVRSPDVFRNLGIDPLAKKLLVVKSTNHFRAEFEKLAAEILYVAPPDVFTNVPFKRIPRPKWPLDPDAFADLPVPA
ncbi:MAG TPA: M81 family metallopeptidase [Methylomirabilota bacterium]|nr:M81 family metallopeptidase [Methylomirabilota bacterium]